MYVQSAHGGLSDVTSEHRCHVIRNVCYVSERYSTRLATLRQGGSFPKVKQPVCVFTPHFYAERYRDFIAIIPYRHASPKYFFSFEFTDQKLI
jgi:hypothetical protein